MRISVSLIVCNEEEKLPLALASVEDLADEIVVVDTGSRDRSREIAAAHPGVHLFDLPFSGFGQSKQAALSHCTGDWILVLDADERVSPELAAKIRSLEVNGQLESAAGFRIRRRNWILGREMTSMGLDRDYPLRLFQREGARFDLRLVHEGVLPAKGKPVGRLEEPLEHETFGGIDQYLRKIDLYTSLELRERPRTGRTWHLIFVWPSTFFRYYVSRRGFRDGFAGFLWAAMTATGKLIRDIKLWASGLPEIRS